MEIVRDVACPTCGRMFNKFSIGRHKPTCPDKPENRVLVAQWLPNPELPGYARTELEYMRSTPNRPCSASLITHFGKWSLVAEAFGLKAVDSNFHRIQNKLNVTGAELRRLSQELHAGVYGPSRKEYSLHRTIASTGTCSMDVISLGDRFGNWELVLANWDMIPPPLLSDTVKPTIKAEQLSNAPYWFSGWHSWRGDNAKTDDG